ncbi:hypothetical protein G7K71_07035 [Desulfofundulus sp. TPOSR]|uniref:hypothetical protein n=1 Tax=Desulfofundulus sp. TPOSR TaxID=2714340 RepID=UPI00140DC84C|nr:hypothetical protein [Desulfofundulus sp. TPOSR]NHM26741.1 hypothetical protein [Desulfofundulus sp. TPOSR]
MDWGKDIIKDGGKEKEKECNCCIKIEDSIVIIICGEDDIHQLCDSLKQVAELKNNDITKKEEANA